MERSGASGRGCPALARVLAEGAGGRPFFLQKGFQNKELKNEDAMVKSNGLIVMRAVAICFKPYLKPEEALVYCNLGRTQFAKKCEEFGIYKNNSGYFKREELNTMLSGGLPLWGRNADGKKGKADKKT